MAKLTLTDLSTTLSNTATFVINNNNTALEAALENTLSRDGSTPNTMEADFDMNSHRILNLLDAENDQEPTTYGQYQDGIASLNSRISSLLRRQDASQTSAKECGAIADGFSHPLSDYYDTLSDAQVVYPHAVSLSDELDWAAVVQSLNNAAITNSGSWLDGGTYIINRSIPIPDKTYWRGPGVLKAANGSSISVVTITNKSDVLISIKEVNGNKANCPDGASGISLHGTLNTRIKIQGVFVHDCQENGISINYCDDVIVEGCTANNNTLAGITIREGVKNGRFVSNHVSYNGTHGLGIIGIASFCIISNNTADTNGPLADNFTGYNAGNSDLVISGNTSYSAINHGIHFGGCRVSYTGNVCYNTSVGNGIRHTNHLGTYDTDVVICGNVCYGSQSISGIHVEKVKGIVVSSNTSNDNTTAGVYLYSCEDISISGNTCQSNGTSGIVVDIISRGVISGNSLFNNTQRGIIVTNSSDLLITGNNCSLNTLDGIRTNLSNTNLSIVGNICKSNSASGIRVDATTSAKVANNVSTNNTNRGFVAGTDTTLVELTDNNLTDNTGGPIDFAVGLSQLYCAEGNKGYNPIGVSSITVGSSPYTYTAGPFHEQVFIQGGTVSSITVGGVSFATVSNVLVPLYPQQSLVITYSSIPTMTTSKH